MTDQELQDHYDDFFEDVFWELEEKYGKIEQMNVCDNLGDHLVGNVYVMFEDEEVADDGHALLLASGWPLPAQWLLRLGFWLELPFSR